MHKGRKCNMGKIRQQSYRGSTFIIGILLILCADNNFYGMPLIKMFALQQLQTSLHLLVALA